MRFTKKIVASILAACLGAAMGVMPAMAAEVKFEQPYEYQVLLYPGDGTLNGVSEAVPYVPKNGYVEIDYSSAMPNDDRYYVKGVRLAGLDNSRATTSADRVLNLPVDGDAQYVVAYGLKKNQVAYTINFVDAAGNQIADPETLYGNPGDKPVVAFRYIDNYLPTTYNLTKTLSENAADNVFTFTYNAAPGVTYTVVDNGVATGAAPAGAAVAPAGAAAVADAAAAGEILGEDGTPLAAPTELEDIDDNDNPLVSGVEPGAEAASFDMNMLLIAGGAVLLIALIAVAAVALRKRNKKAAANK